MTNAELLNAALDAARAASAILRDGYGTSFEVRSKDGRHNLVTEYDVRCERVIAEVLRRYTPDASILGEEGGLQPGGDLTWVVDPLDGTVNFAHGVPIFCVSIAAVRSGEPVCGTIVHPLLGEEFTAIRHEGAYLNGRRLHVSSIATLSESYLVTGFPYNARTNPGGCIDQFGAMIRRGAPVRRLGSAALDLAYVAAGRFDGYWEVALHPWDMAAGVLLVTEAGGTVSKYGNAPWTLEYSSIVATNGHIHRELTEALTL